MVKIKNAKSKDTQINHKNYSVQSLKGQKKKNKSKINQKKKHVPSKEMVLNENYEEFPFDEAELNDEMADTSSEEYEETEEKIESGSVTGGKVTLSMVKTWETLLDEKSPIQTFKNIQQALSAAVGSIKGSEKLETSSPYIVKGPQIFNAVVRLCLKKVAPTLHSLFELKSLSDKPTKNKKWFKLLPNIKKYLLDLILLTKSISEPSVVEALLKKAILPVLPFYSEILPVSWKLTRQMANLWCTSHEKVRVLSLVALFRLISSYNEDYREKSLKLLYISYVNNCRFTSPSTLPLIDFMRMSLVELYSMDHALTYRHAFLYIRQLAFHLRNAMLVQKKDRLQLVYSWQFIHCLHFWADLLASTHPSNVLQPLVYPLTQIANGCLTLLKTPKYYPLTFHVCNILTNLSRKTGTFIPVLPYLLEILSCQKLRTVAKKNSLKPFEWKSILKVSASQMLESAFPDGLIDQFFDCSITYLNSQCSSISFPELVFPMTLQLKTFLKKCKIPTYTRKVKQLLDKANENSEFINQRRKEVSFGIADTEALKNWEIETEQSNPPFRNFHNQWKTMQEELKKSEKPSEEVDEFSIKAIRKRQREDEFEMEKDDENEEEEEEAAKFSEKQAKKQKVEKKTKKAKGKNPKKVAESMDQENEDTDPKEDVVKEMKLKDYSYESDSD